MRRSAFLPVPPKVWAVLGLASCLGCGLIGNYQSIYFYPVGPTPSHAAVKGTIHNLSGRVELKMPEGRTYTGNVASVARPADPTDPLFMKELDFPKGWDAVYGEGYYRSVVYGSNLCFRGKLVSDSNDPIFVEIVRLDPHSMERVGVALTSDKRLFKVTF
jgi:hypothetical protein